MKILSRLRRGVLVGAGCLLLAAPLAALEPGLSLLVPAAARDAGWVTDLYVFNPGEEAAMVTLYWLERDQPNPSPLVVSFRLDPGETRVMGDVLSNAYHLTQARGAFRVLAKGQRVVVSARVYTTRDGATFGQGIEAVPAELAIGPASSGGQSATDVVGLANSSAFRSTVYAVSGSEGARLVLTLFDPTGSRLGDPVVLELGLYEPILVNVADLVDEHFDDATLHVEVESGSAVVGASKVDNDPTTGDPSSLEPWYDGGRAGLEDAGTYSGVVRDASGFLGGMVMVVDEQRRVTSLDFTFPSSLCGATFGGGVVFQIPIALAELADGITFGPSAFPIPGELVWHLTLSEREPNLSFEGTLSATGKEFVDAYEDCNGEHPGDEVELGKAPGDG